MAIDPVTAIQAASAIAGFLGSRKKQKTGLDLGQLRREAKANGFNPLTVLRMTGGAGFDRSPQPNMLTSLADLGTGVSSAIMGAQDREIMRRESDARIGLLAGQTDLINRQLGVPSIQTSSPVRGGVRPVGLPNPQFTEKPLTDFDPRLSAAEKAALLAEQKGVSGMNENIAPQLTMFGIDVFGSGGWSSGQTFEDALGEGPLQWVISPLILADMLTNTAAERAGIGEWFRTPIREWEIFEKMSGPINGKNSPVYNRLADHFYDPMFD